MEICKPVVNKSLDHMNGLQRTAESFRYVVLSVEFWISPEGHIREWLRKNLRWSAGLMVPTVTVFPIVTMALWEVESWVKTLTNIAGHLIFLPILALLAFVSISICTRVFRR